MLSNLNEAVADGFNMKKPPNRTTLTPDQPLKSFWHDESREASEKHGWDNPSWSNKAEV